jgi:glucose-1-phosphate thymidylyltransferase
MKGLLLAGGWGTRLRPLTFTGNKHMLPIANKPMLLYGLEHLQNAGITEVGIILGPLKEGVIQAFGDGSDLGLEISYIEQPDPKGLAHAILVAEKYLSNESFVMYLGDNLLRQGVQPFIDVFNQQHVDCVIGATKVTNPRNYGVVVFNQDGSINKLIEKPKERLSDWALIGIYVFNPKIFNAVKAISPSWRGELEITDAIQQLFSTGASVTVQKVEGWWKDTGKPSDLLEANQLVLEAQKSYNHGVIEDGVTITGNHIGIGKKTIIHNRTTLRGPIIIGENCKLGPNTYIGPYTALGDNVTVVNSEIENSIVMHGTHIDCDQRIVDSIIGRNVKVVNSDTNQPKGHRLILGDTTYVSI